MALKQLLKPLAFHLLAKAGPSALCRYLNRKSASILMFHGFYKDAPGGVTNYDGKHLNVLQFEAVLRHLTQHHHVVPLARLVEALIGGRALPERSIVLTFDDGYASNYHHAFPLLKKYQAPASIFLATEFVDGNQPLWPDRIEHAFDTTSHSSLNLDWAGLPSLQPLDNLSQRVEAAKQVKLWLKSRNAELVLTKVAELEQALEVDPAHMRAAEIYKSASWDQIREMRDSGLVEFGAHTHTHRILGHLAPDIVHEEIATCTAIMERELGGRPRFFCYPNGTVGNWSDVSTQILKDFDYQCALTTITALANQSSNRYSLPRCAIADGWSHNYFILRCSGMLADS